MATFEPELWVDRAGAAIDFYVEAFGATELMRIGEGDDSLGRLDVDGAVFWVVAADPGLGRLSPVTLAGATGRTLLVTDDPDEFCRRAVAAGALERSPVADEHGWRIGRIGDPFGHEWEIGVPQHA
jgi:PhnB protein